MSITDDIVADIETREKAQALTMPGIRPANPSGAASSLVPTHSGELLRDCVNAVFDEDWLEQLVVRVMEICVHALMEQGFEREQLAPTRPLLGMAGNSRSLCSTVFMRDPIGGQWLGLRVRFVASLVSPLAGNAALFAWVDQSDTTAGGHLQASAPLLHVDANRGVLDASDPMAAFLEHIKTGVAAVGEETLEQLAAKLAQSLTGALTP